MIEPKPRLADDVATPGQVLPRCWLVLVVDDEPQVHEVTRMLLANARFCGRPIELHSVYSAEAARAFLRAHSETALVLLDVVMETDDAGLRLVRYVREQLGNDDVQIVLRTGQPGQAPEADVVLNYDINGYFLKTEVTAQKLNSIVIAALRAYHYIRTLKKHRQHSFCDDDAGLPPRQQAERAQRLDIALAREGLEPIVQPQVDLTSGRIVGLELLARWRCGEAGDAPLAPARLMTTVGQAGLQIRLGDWLLRQLGALVRTWREHGLEPPRVAIDVTLELLRSAEFIASLERCLQESALRPAQLELELAETGLWRERSQIEDALGRLRARGVSLAVDNFGTGMTSPAQLKQLQPQRVKIDAGLVSGVATNPDSAVITRALIALAHTLGIAVVASGVQNKEQLEFLKWEGCELGQGEFLSPQRPGIGFSVVNW